jgi:hypothetical protein
MLVPAAHDAPPCGASHIQNLRGIYIRWPGKLFNRQRTEARAAARRTSNHRPTVL